MPTIGIEMCDAGFRAATFDKDKSEAQVATETDASRGSDWPGFAYYDGQTYSFGRVAEEQWFVHPRRVRHSFWTRLAHEPSTLGPIGKPAPFSQLAFHFFREYTEQIKLTSSDRVVLAVPGSYLKDAATEDEKIGLLLGMANELKLPLVGIVDSACAALCDPRANGFNPTLPVVVIDLCLEGTELTLLTSEEQLARKDFLHLPQSGLTHLLKHVTATMANRFLRHTAFDILEDGQVEQMFFRQTKDFLFSDAPEHRFHINTATRGYELLAKREQLVTDAAAFVATLVQGLQTFLHNSPHASEPCTIALTERAAHIPGVEARLRAVGHHRILRLPAGAAAAGAARFGESRLTVPEDLADVPVDIAVPLSFARRANAPVWEARLLKGRVPGPRPAPTHAILDGIGHAFGQGSHFTIGVANGAVEVSLPDSFNISADCSVSLVREGGRWWFVDSTPARDSAGTPTRATIDSGDHLSIRCGTAAADVLFAHCAANSSRGHD